MKKTFWELICIFFNNITEGEIGTRKDLTQYLLEEGQIKRNKFYPNTIYVRSMDTYRAYLTKGGYISHTNKKGHYKKVKNIPLDISKNEIKRRAYKN